MAGRFGNLKRKARGLSNLGGISRLVCYAESDLTTGWPKKADIEDGEIDTVPPIVVGTVAAEFVFDNNTCRGKSLKKGRIGYQNYEHEIEAKFAGFDPTQYAVIEKFLNEGGVAIAYHKNGARQVFGSSWNPLEIEDGMDTGIKADDGVMISLKAKADGFDFHAPFLATSVTLATDSAAVVPQPF
ncbi:MAG: hypothetical protein U0X91_20765 [Spirosomataceae bacterium]